MKYYDHEHQAGGVTLIFRYMIDDRGEPTACPRVEMFFLGSVLCGCHTLSPSASAKQCCWLRQQMRKDSKIKRAMRKIAKGAAA